MKNWPTHISIIQSWNTHMYTLLDIQPPVSQLLKHWSNSNVVGKCVVGCLLFVSFRSIHVSQSWKQSSKQTLFIPVFSLSRLCLTHFNCNIYICLIAAQNSSVFNLRCTEPMQHNHIHSIHWPFTHPFTCKHIHIQLTIHSYHRHMLSHHYIMLIPSKPKITWNNVISDKPKH